MDIEKQIENMLKSGVDIWQVAGNLCDMLREPPDLTQFLLAEDAFRACVARMEIEAADHSR